MFEEFLTLTLLAEHLELAVLIDLVCLMGVSILVQCIRLWRWVTLSRCQMVWTSRSKLIGRLMKVGPRAEFKITLLDRLNYILLCLLFSFLTKTTLQQFCSFSELRNKQRLKSTSFCLDFVMKTIKRNKNLEIDFHQTVGSEILTQAELKCLKRDVEELSMRCDDQKK